MTYTKLEELEEKVAKLETTVKWLVMRMKSGNGRETPTRKSVLKYVRTSRRSLGKAKEDDVSPPTTLPSH